MKSLIKHLDPLVQPILFMFGRQTRQRLVSGTDRRD